MMPAKKKRRTPRKLMTNPFVKEAEEVWSNAFDLIYNASIERIGFGSEYVASLVDTANDDLERAIGDLAWLADEALIPRPHRPQDSAGKRRWRARRDLEEGMEEVLRYLGERDAFQALLEEAEEEEDD